MIEKITNDNEKFTLVDSKKENMISVSSIATELGLLSAKNLKEYIDAKVGIAVKYETVYNRIGGFNQAIIIGGKEDLARIGKAISGKSIYIADKVGYYSI